jgi:phospholipase/lecithinase/hemolysin
VTQLLIAIKTQEEPMNKLVIVILIGLLLTACTAAPAPTATPTTNPTDTLVLPPTYTPAPHFSHVYAFGDSLSDVGHDFKIAKDLAAKGQFDPNIVKIAENNNWNGRDSNGPVAVEVLTDKLKVDLTDYAVGGATTGYDNANGDLWNNTGLMAQIDQFEAGLEGKQADPNALYFIHISANDFIKNIIIADTHDLTETVGIADQAIANIDIAVKHLAKLGAKRFMVANSAEIFRAPDVNSLNWTVEALAFQQRINSRLPDEMEKLAKQLNLNMNIFDYTALSDQMHRDIAKYNLTNVAEVCAYPDQYYYWDGLHPTRRVHQLIGESMAEQLSK